MTLQLIKQIGWVIRFKSRRTYLNLSKPIRTYPTISEPIWTYLNLSESIHTYPNLCQLIQTYPVSKKNQNSMLTQFSTALQSCPIFIDIHGWLSLAWMCILKIVKKKFLSCKSIGQNRCQQEHCSNLSFDIENQTKLSSRAPRQSNQVALIIFRSEMNQPTKWGADTNYKLWHGKPKLIFNTTTFLDLAIQVTLAFL